MVKQDGFSTLEILVALAVIILTLTAVFLVSFGSQTLLIDSQNNSEALNKAQDLLEQAKNDAKLGFDLVQDKTTTDGIYIENLDVTELDAVTKKITATISWQSGQHKVDLYTIVSDLANGPGANTCSYILTGNWAAPQIASTTVANYPITDIDAYLGKLYVTAGPTTAKTDPTLFVYDLTNPKSPTLVAGDKVDNDSSVTAGLNAVSVADGYAYVAVAGSKQLQIYNVNTNPPTLIETYQVPGVTANSTQGIGNAIFYKGGYVYLGLTSPVSGPGFDIINVTTPTSPTTVGGAVIGHAVNSVYVRDHYAYVASPNTNDVQVFDITPASLTLNMSPLATFDGTGGAHGKSILALDNSIYLGRTFGSNELYDINATNITTLSERGHADIGTDAGTSINGLVIRNNLAFLLTTSDGLQVWNISNPASMAKTVTVAMPAAGTGAALDCEGNTVYSGSNDTSSHGSLSAIFAP